MTSKSVKSILGIGNALTDILAILPDDSILQQFNLPKGSMQHVDAEAGNKIWEAIKDMGIKYVAGGSAANTLSAAAIFGMKAGFIGKVGKDDIGSLFKSEQRRDGIDSMVLRGKAPSGRAIVIITEPNYERTFATYLGAALELEPEDLDPANFDGYDYLHLEGYLVQNQRLFRRAVEIGREKNMIISVDLASYNIVESNSAFLHDIVENYVDIVFANEHEARAFTGKEPAGALTEIAKMCDIAVVKVGEKGSMVRSGSEYHKIRPRKAVATDATGAGDLYAAGFLYAHSLGQPLDICGKVASIISSKVVEVIGTKLDVPRWREAKKDIRKVMGISE
ncbi:MAG: adenosine kinase [Bacteroidales bacterium]|jgi:sugar/nucleoside kinase (ribokinase family)|nr:adenosine kinase [Bacteroidales bacterium]MBR3527443.1 adenosine kinase [Bacteroidales bacterium]